jgi:hypothetical protein
MGGTCSTYRPGNKYTNILNLNEEDNLRNVRIFGRIIQIIEHNIRINSTEFDVDWIYLAHYADQWRAVLKTDIYFRLPTSLKCRKFLDCLSDN